VTYNAWQQLKLFVFSHALPYFSHVGVASQSPVSKHVTAATLLVNPESHDKTATDSNDVVVWKYVPFDGFTGAEQSS